MNWDKQQRIYERKAYRIIQKHLKTLLNDLPINNVSLSTLNYLLYANITDEKIKVMLLDLYKEVGLNYGNKVNLTLERVKKDNILFNETFLKEILLFLNNQGLIKIVSIRDSLINDLVKAVNDEIAKQGSLISIRDIVYNIVRKTQLFYKWQALRIARTETTFASNFAAVKAAQNSGFEMIKTWIAVSDNRTRHDHAIENNQSVDFDKPFKMADGTLMMYAGDPSAPAKQVINCRCTVGFEGKRDKDGMLILK
jgi:hypothetical protein